MVFNFSYRLSRFSKSLGKYDLKYVLRSSNDIIADGNNNNAG